MVTLGTKGTSGLAAAGVPFPRMACIAEIPSGTWKQDSFKHCARLNTAPWQQGSAGLSELVHAACCTWLGCGR